MTSIGKRKLISALTRVALVTSLTWAGTARADVLEIAPNGSLKVLSDVPNSTWSKDAATPSTGVPDSAITIVNDRVWDGVYATALDRVARTYDISPHLLEALIWQESRWNPAAVSRAGAIGLAQLMPGTARDLGVNPRDPTQNIAGGARYLRQQLNRFNGDLEKALAAYNAGPGRVTTAGGVPAIPETQAYVRAIVTRLASNTLNQGERQ